eukprot:gb/GECG01015511.1/.p1 GENE.gb/GECG01015511.1/~~gb/GECG01015511.1/.p1  ORF type:complete len:106 (+),score=8.92 gb/GECG01015511.1/:1-318(+)
MALAERESTVVRVFQVSSIRFGILVMTLTVVSSHLRICSKESPKLLHTSLLQAFVLLLFNKRSTWSLEGISRAIDFPEHVTSQVMHSLTVRAKKRISNNGEIIKR